MLICRKTYRYARRQYLGCCRFNFAAGIFTGILSGTGMVEAMSKEFVAMIPTSMGPYLAPITALVSMPLTFFMSNDAFFYGVLPILAEAASHYGISQKRLLVHQL